MRFYGFSAHGNSRRNHRTTCWTRTSTRSLPGRCATATASLSTSTPPTARCCCASPAWASGRLTRSFSARSTHRLRLDDLKRLAGSIQRLRPFVVTADHRPTRSARPSDLRTVVAPRVGAVVAVRMTYTVTLRPARRPWTNSAVPPANSWHASRPARRHRLDAAEPPEHCSPTCRRPDAAKNRVLVPRAFADLADAVICHRDDRRWPLLYRGAMAHRPGRALR